MNVLIVNAFGTSPKATSQFEKFCEIIDTLLRKVSFKSGIGNFFYSYRSVDQLDDFIYNLPYHRLTHLYWDSANFFHELQERLSKRYNLNFEWKGVEK